MKRTTKQDNIKSYQSQVLFFKALRVEDVQPLNHSFVQNLSPNEDFTFLRASLANIAEGVVVGGGPCTAILVKPTACAMVIFSLAQVTFA